jgi:multiple antibiotic resistance protein
MEQLAPILKYAFVALSSVFFLVDPFAAVPSFLAITNDATHVERQNIARKASLTCFFVLAGFAFVGRYIFRALGITLPAFEIAGGVILLLTGLEMLRAQRITTNETPGETQEGVEKEDASIIPLGIPILAGPGAISTVMVLVAQTRHPWQQVVVFAAIAISAFASYLVLAAGDAVRRVLGETGIRVLMRIMGLLLTALAVQFVLSGLQASGVLQPLADR